MFLSAGRSDGLLLPRSSSAEVSDDPLSSRSSTAEVSDAPLSPRSSSAEVSEDSLSSRSSTAECSEDSLRPRSSVAERTESILLALSTAGRRRASFFMVRRSVHILVLRTKGTAPAVLLLFLVVPIAPSGIRAIGTHLIVKSYFVAEIQQPMSLYLDNHHRWLHISFPVHNRVGLIVQTVI